MDKKNSNYKNSHIKILFIVVLHMWVFHQCVCLCTMCTWYPCRREEGFRFPGIVVIDGCESLCGCWEFTLNPLQNQPLLLTTEPSLSSLILYFLNIHLRWEKLYFYKNTLTFVLCLKCALLCYRLKLWS